MNFWKEVWAEAKPDIVRHARRSLLLVLFVTVWTALCCLAYLIAWGLGL